MTVVDAAEAVGSSFGRWLAAAPTGPAGWAVRTDELDEFTARLRLTASVGSRETGDGRVLRWRLAGVEQAASEPLLPFFIEWGTGASLPGTTPIAHPAGPAELVGIELEGDPARLASWLGRAVPRCESREGAPRVVRVVMRAGERTVVLDAASLG